MSSAEQCKCSIPLARSCAVAGSVLWCVLQFSSDVSEELRVWAGRDHSVVLRLAEQCFLELSRAAVEAGVLRRAVYGGFLGHIAARTKGRRMEALQHWEEVRGGGSHDNWVPTTYPTLPSPPLPSLG